MKALVVAAFVAVLVVLAGCSADVSVGDPPEESSESARPTIEEAELEREVSDQLEQSVGQAPDEIDCPEDLAGKVGTEMRCVLRAGRDRLGVTVTVTGVKGEQVDFDIEVDEEMME